MPILQFKGKTFVQNHHLAVKYHQLIPKSELSLTDKVSLHDNLKALKALLPTYAGRINVST
jgi:adenine-specific DNA-methyltransferase